MSLTRKASSATKKPIKSPRQDLAAALAERDAELAEARSQNARLFDEVQAHKHDVAEALEQQKATSDVLQVISRSSFDLDSVFRTLVEKAVRLCGATTGMIFQRDGELMRLAAADGATAEFVNYVRGNPIAPGRGAVTGRAALEGRTVHVLDIENDPEYSYGGLSLERYRTIVAVPLMRKGAPVGVFTLWRHNVEAFTPRQIALVETFADQAVVAIENARLFREAQEALEQQRASAEVLGAISKSVADASPVFETILDACQRLFGSEELGIYTIGDDQMVRVAAWRGPRAEEARQDVTPLADSVTGRVIRERRPHHIPDLGAVPNLSPTLRDRVNRHGGASLLYAPMLQEDSGLGSIVVVRWPPRPFSDREQALLQTFADQAAIAIENARLFRETQEALRQQTATGDILKVIASSPNNLQPVLDKIVETACRLCSAYDSVVLLREGDQLRPAAHYGPIPLTFASQEISRGLLAGRAVIERRAIHIDDIAKHADEYPVAAALALQGQVAGSGEMLWRANLVMPLMREGEAVGVIGLRRTEPMAFSETQIQLLKTFADQAVIAIENVRLFDEVQARTRDLTESLEQQTASAEILRVISSSPTDVQPVFDAIAHSAAALCEATNGAVFRLRDGLIHLVGHYSMSQKQLASLRQSFPAPLDRAIASGRAILDRAIIHIPDVAVEPGYPAALAKTGLRSVLSVPMLRNGESIGSINVSREAVRPFSGRQIELLKIFADQAVIAINNVGLFNETQQALERQTATADILKVIASSPTDVQPVFEAIATSANQLLGGISSTVWRFIDDALILVAFTRTSPAADEALQAAFPRPLAEFPPFLPARDGRTEQFFDTESESGVPPLLRDLGRLRGFRSMLFAPLMSNGVAAGLISVTRKEPGAFVAADVQLLRTFADQAVIAIENVRLFDEVQARTKDLQEALQQQTATTNVLKVISRSAFDLDAVLKTLTNSARSLSGAATAAVFLRDGDALPASRRVGGCSGISQVHGHPSGSPRQSYPHWTRGDDRGARCRSPTCAADPDYDYGVGPQDRRLSGNVRRAPDSGR